MPPAQLQLQLEMPLSATKENLLRCTEEKLDLVLPLIKRSVKFLEMYDTFCYVLKTVNFSVSFFDNIFNSIVIN